MASTQTVSRGPTTATLWAIEDVLKKAAVPVSRYQIRKELGNKVAAPLLDEALDYMAEHEMVYDQGPGGKVLWIRASAETLQRLKGK